MGSVNWFWKTSQMYSLHYLSNPRTDVRQLDMQGLECKGEVWNVGKPLELLSFRSKGTDEIVHVGEDVQRGDSN